MVRTSEVAYPVADLIRNRKSVRSFSPEPVGEENIKSLFEATRWAPSSTNEQPWVYLYATADQSELFEKFLECLEPGNRIWAKEAPLLIFSMSRKKFTRRDIANAHAMYDLGGANSFLSIQAVELGLQVRQMAGYNYERTVKNLNIPEDYALGVFIAVGYPGDGSKLPEHLQLRETEPRTRIVQNEFVFNGTL